VAEKVIADLFGESFERLCVHVSPLRKARKSRWSNARALI
jgi:hypothetical protein